jgi:hypothetical protein
MKLATFIERFNKGDFHDETVSVQCDAGWYDWFCRDTSLARKTDILGKKAVQLAASDKINVETMYVWFKNNCPMGGPLYDDLRFADLETGDVVYTVIPKCSHSGKAEVWGHENDFDGPLVKGTWRDVKEFFGLSKPKPPAKVSRLVSNKDIRQLA